jgi:hypothetical protein
MSLTYFAHDGEAHETTQEAAAHEAQTGVTIPFDVVAGLSTLLIITMFLLVTTYAFKLKFPTKMLVVMATLLIVGVLGYQSAPVTSVIALAVGFAMALGGMFLQLMPGKHRR